MATRIIAKLDVKPPNVVKPLLFEGLKVVGLPKDLAKKYYEQGADEVFYTDIVASLYQREILYQNIQETADEIFIPFAVGGGIKNVQDISKLFHIGADKVVINTYALQTNPQLINEAAKIFGSQAVVVNIEAKKWDRWYECYSDGGRIPSTKDVYSWAQECQQRGAGEILLQTIDNDGLQEGFDLEISKKMVDSLDIPVVLSSGAGNLEDIKEVINYAKPSGVAIASMLHFNKTTISQIKQYLRDNNIEVSA